MRLSAAAFVAAFLALIAVGVEAHTHRASNPNAQQGSGTAGQFDYYVLTLTDVPEFCSSHNDPNECGKREGFALHGLWPQYENGKWPSFCQGPALTSDLKSRYAGIFASPTMINNEWSKHGTCSGLAPADYFQTADTYHKKVVIPDVYAKDSLISADQVGALRQALIDNNPGLQADDLLTQTENGQVAQVEICVTKAGAFRSCKPD